MTVREKTNILTEYRLHACTHRGFLDVPIYEKKIICKTGINFLRLLGPSCLF